MKIQSILHPFVMTALIGMSLALTNEVLAAPLTSSSTAQYVPGEVLVEFKPTTSTQSNMATVASFGGTVQTNLNHNLLQVKLGANQSVEASIAAYKNDPNVALAQPNYIYHTTAATPSNALSYGQQWAFKNTGQTILNTNTQPSGTALSYTTNNPGTAGKDMDIEPAWGVITDCSSVVVAVIDTGVNYNQQDLTTNMWTSATYPNHGYNYTTEGVAADPMDLNGHGTHVAGIIGAIGNNTSATTGVCWKASIMAVRALDSTGAGTTTTIIQGINFAVTNGAKVINMSLAGPSNSYDAAFSTAITNAQNNDVVVVVAAGNNTSNNDTTPEYPCSFTQPNLLCVAALDQSYALASFSDWGATSVDVGAPGTNILSTWAGTKTVVSDNLSATAPWTVNVAGWGYGTWTDSTSAIHNMLADPGTGTYLASVDHHVYKNFSLSGNSVAVLNFSLAGTVNTGDAFGVAMSSTGGDPFVAAGKSILNSGSFSSPNSFVAQSFNITPCITTTCTLGFSLTSTASSTGAMGPMVTYFSIDELALNNTSYNTENGTSMASPAVAGLATMLRAYNPQYTSADVVAAIENAGRATTSLAGKTTTGKAVDVMASLAYINAPTGLAATVQ
jgi:thermitase